MPDSTRKTNPYNFDAFLDWRSQVDYYSDDPFVQKVIRCYAGDRFEAVDAAAREMSPRASFRWRDLSETIAWPEKRPYMMHYDGHNHRIDRIIRPRETEILEKEVFAEALFSEKTDPWVKLAQDVSHLPKRRGLHLLPADLHRGACGRHRKVLRHPGTGKYSQPLQGGHGR